ncbi:MAG: NHL repeat-containing protein, partial [Armatimonadota bacterium]
MLLAILALGMTQSALEAPAGVAYDAEGLLYVSWMGSNVITVHRGVEEVRRIEGGLSAPRGLAFDDAGRLYVADSGSHRVLVFNRSGSLLRTLGGEGTADGKFRAPYGVLVDARGNIIVADTYNNRLQFFDGEGRHLKTFGALGDQPGQFREPAGLALSNGSLYVAGGWLGRVDVYDYDARTLSPTFRRSITGFWVCGDVAVLADGSIVALDRNNGWVGRWDRDGNEVKRFGGGSYGLFRHPSAVVQTPSGELAIADTGNDRVLLLGADFADVSRPLLARLTPSSATVEWRTAPEDESPSLSLFRRADRHNGEHVFQRQVAAVGKDGAASGSVGRLEPGSGYVVQPQSTLVRSIDGSGESGRLRALAFATEPREGEKTIL